MGEFGEFSNAHGACEAYNDVVASVDLEDRGSAFSKGLFVVGDVRAICRAHLANHGSRGFDELGEAKSRADLDHLSATQHNFTPLPRPGARKGRRDERKRRGTVVDHKRVLRCRARLEQRLTRRDATLASQTSLEIELDINVARSGFQGVDRLG